MKSGCHQGREPDHPARTRAHWRAFPLVIEHELPPGEDGPKQIFQHLPSNRLRVPACLGQQSGEPLDLHSRRLPAQRELEQTTNRVLIAHLLNRPLLDAALLRAQLVVQRLPVVQVQRLGDAGILLPLAGTGLRPVGPAERVEEPRRHPRVSSP